jgi:hypothetical protein
MRLFPAAALAAILAGASAGSATAQSELGAQPGPSVLAPDNGSNANNDNNVIAVPPAPAIVAAPPSPPMPRVPATPVPPGLVTASPPANVDIGGTDSGTDNGNADNGGQPGGDNGAAAPQTAQPGTGQANTSQDQSQDQDVIPVPPNDWQPGKLAEIGVLDKVGGGVKQVSIPVGGQSVVGDLQVNVLACVIRPPGQVPDAAVFLALQSTDNLSGPPDYRGWLVRSAPGAAVAGDASEIFRIIGCS